MNILEEKILQRIDEYAKYCCTAIADKYDDEKLFVMDTGHFIRRKISRGEEEHNKYFKTGRDAKKAVMSLLKRCSNDIMDRVNKGYLDFDQSEVNDRRTKGDKYFVGIHDNDSKMNVVCVLKEYEGKKYIVVKSMMYKDNYVFKKVGSVIKK